jgi:hypothetical protein
MSVTVVAPTCQWDTNGIFPNCENYNGIFPSNPICKHIYSCRGSFSKSFSQTIFITQVAQLFWEKQLGTTGLPVRSSPGTQPHPLPENNSCHENIPTQTLFLWPHRDSSNTVDMAIRIGFTLYRGCTSLPTSRVPPHEHLSVGADPIKTITHLS